jgi:uncharacterized protein
MEFEWDPRQDSLNRQKHNVSFLEASTVFDDPLSTAFPDPDHSIGENRYVMIGISKLGQLLVVSETIGVRLTGGHRGQATRIISARPANRSEKRFYERGT